jgi:SAM-dependent methyltransferase
MNPLRVAIAKVRWSLHHRGIFGTLKKAATRLVPGSNGAHAQVPHPFDTEHGVETSGLLTAVDLASGSPNDLLVTGYGGTPPSRFRFVFNQWISAPPENPIPSYSFLDIGAGKGRAMLLASEYPFREIIGVEMNRGLIDIASANLEKWRASGHPCPPTRVVCQDVLEFEFPETPCLFYLYNPFAEPILRQLIDHIEGSFSANPRPLDILYCHPVSPELFEKHPSYVKLWSAHVPISPEEAEAEPFASSDELCCLFRRIAR